MNFRKIPNWKIGIWKWKLKQKFSFLKPNHPKNNSCGNRLFQKSGTEIGLLFCFFSLNIENYDFRKKSPDICLEVWRSNDFYIPWFISAVIISARFSLMEVNSGSIFISLPSSMNFHWTGQTIAYFIHFCL